MSHLIVLWNCKRFWKLKDKCRQVKILNNKKLQESQVMNWKNKITACQSNKIKSLSKKIEPKGKLGEMA